MLIIAAHRTRLAGKAAASLLRSALAVRDMLVQIGIPAKAIEIVGRGARELLVPTADGIAEERNRRVEIKRR